GCALRGRQLVIEPGAQAAGLKTAHLDSFPGTARGRRARREPASPPPSRAPGPTPRRSRRTNVPSDATSGSRAADRVGRPAPVAPPRPARGVPPARPGRRPRGARRPAPGVRLAPAFAEVVA